MFRAGCERFCLGNETRTQDVTPEGLYASPATPQRRSPACGVARSPSGLSLCEYAPEVDPIGKGFLGNDIRERADDLMPGPAEPLAKTGSLAA